MFAHRLLFAPRWQTQLATGLPFGFFMGLVMYLRGDVGGWGAVVFGVVQAVLFGLVFGWWLHRLNAPLRERLDHVPPTPAARRAVLRGPLPDDPRDRHATGVLVQHHLAQLERHRRGNLVVPGLFVVAGPAAAFLFQEPWSLLLSVCGVVILVQHLWTLQRLQQRRTLLSA